MHVFLTGDVQIGKSTAIRRAIAQLQRRPSHPADSAL